MFIISILYKVLKPTTQFRHPPPPPLPRSFIMPFSKNAMIK